MLGSPSQMLWLHEKFERRGLAPGEAAAHCLDFDLACMWFGRWTDERREATKDVPVNKNERKRHTRSVPRFTTLGQILGTEPAGTHVQPKPQDEQQPPPEIEQKVDELRRNPQALVDFLRLHGEG